MPFDLLGRVLELTPERIVALRAVDPDEEYLRDHFPTFPVLPGVLMLEAMVQAARRLLAARDAACAAHVLGAVRALKYGSFVRPGDSLRVEVVLSKSLPGNEFDFRGEAAAIRADAPGPESAPDPCASGRFVLRPPRD